MATLEGFLFAALSFSWQDPGRGFGSPIVILCVVGIFVAGLSWRGIWIADNKINEMLQKLGDHSYRFGIDPPVWGPVDYAHIGRSRPWADRFLIPWIWLPIVIIVAWMAVFGMHYLRPDSRLKGAWPDIVQKYMQVVFEHQSETDKALERLAGMFSDLAGMFGDPAKGETIFKERGCTGCHFPKDDALSVETLQKKGNRIEIVRGILSPRSPQEQQAHGKSMPKGILGTMSPEEFLDVVEYLSSPPP